MTHEIAARSRLYGRSKGKALRQRQSELMTELLPKLLLDLIRPITLREDRETCLEIGFGGGEHLIEAASLAPEIDFIGCEPFVNGVAKLLSKIDARGLTNISLHQGDAVQILDLLPNESLTCVYLFYPDPWPKRRHRKRRFVSQENLTRLARVMKPNAQLRFATDIDDYAAWTLARIQASAAFRWKAALAEDWRLPWPNWTQTKYESKAIAAGRHPAYLTFIKQAD